MTTAHAPKIAALRAEAAGLLSGEGRRRLLAHVERCAVCAEQLRGARRFHAVLSGGARKSLPQFDGNLVAQRAFARERLARRRATATWVGLGLAAALAFTIAILVQPAPPGAEPVSDEPALVARTVREAPVGAPLPIAITALSGEVRVRDAQGGEKRVAMETPLVEGNVLRLSPTARIDLALGRVAGVRLGPDTVLTLARARDELVTLQLGNGEVASAVAPRSAAQTFEVEAAGFTVRVRGTLFAVRARAGSVEVQCDEGSVEVIGADGTSHGVLKAPAIWRGGSQPQAAAPAEPGPVAQPNPLVADSAVLTLPKLETVSAWELGGRVQSAASELQMRVPRGQAELTALLAGGGRQTIPVVIDAVGKRVNPEDLRLGRPAGEEAHDATLPPPMAGHASEVIRIGRPALQRCYEHSLKNETGGALSVRLSIALDPRGKVRSVAAKPVAKPGAAADLTLPEALDRCIRTNVSSWRFPPPGPEGAVIEAPLRFQLRNP